MSRKRVPLNQNECTANFRIGVPFEQNLHTSALGAVQAVEDAGKTGQIDILGKDGAPIGKHAVKDGTMVQTSAQRPTYMGYLGVKEAIDLLEGKEIEFNTAIESYSITADNIDDYDLDAWDSLEE